MSKLGDMLPAPSEVVQQAKQDGTFRLTAMSGPHDDGRPSSKQRFDVETLQGVQKFRTTHAELSAVVSQLSDKVSGVLTKQEGEFMAAYRAHMFNVQKELQALRTRVDEAELKMKRNDRIRELERARDWFRTEAQRLDEYVEEMKGKIVNLEEQMEVVAHDRDLYKTELKAAKKKNKILLAELRLRLAADAGPPNAHSLAAGSPSPAPQRRTPSAASRGGAGSRRGGGGLPPTAGAASPLRSRPATRGSTGRRPPTRNARARTALSVRRGGGMHPSSTAPAGAGFRVARGGTPSARRSDDGLDDGATGPADTHRRSGAGADGDREGEAEAQALRASVARLQRHLDGERREVRRLRAAAVEEQSARSQLEEFFLQAIDDVRRDVARRRSRSQQEGMKRRNDALASPSPLRSPGLRAPPSAFSAGGTDFALGATRGTRRGEGSVQLGDFREADRRRVVARLLGEDRVLGALYDALFPPEDAEGEAAQAGAPGGVEVHRATTSGARAGSSTEHGEGTAAPADEGRRRVDLDPAVEAYLRAAKEAM